MSPGNIETLTLHKEPFITFDFDTIEYANQKYIFQGMQLERHSNPSQVALRTLQHFPWSPSGGNWTGWSST